MNKEVKELRKKFKKYNIDGYVIPKNDDYFTEYSKINRLKIISNFSGSAGLAIVLKDKNYLFTDGRYTIQSQRKKELLIRSRDRLASTKCRGKTATGRPAHQVRYSSEAQQRRQLKLAKPMLSSLRASASVVVA